MARRLPTAVTTAVNFLLTIALGRAALALQCVGDDGSPVDWFVVLKHSGNTSYLYADADNPSLATSSHTLDDKGAGALANTVVPALGANYALYNDEVPNDGPNSSKYGHTKGVVGVSADASTGFWLVHSVPQAFGVTGGVYEGYPSTGVMYGQSMLCVSLGVTALNSLAEAMKLTRPQFFAKSLSATVQAKLPDLYDVVTQETWTSPATSTVFPIKSSGGATFTVFAKNVNWNNELYSALVAEHFGEDIWCETWMHGTGDLQNFCTPEYPENTWNIESYVVDEYTMAQNKDHSKIAVLPASGTFCVGDINRASTQYKRGGGTACFSAPTIASQVMAEAVHYTVAPRGGCAPAPSGYAMQGPEGTLAEAS